MYLFNVQIQSEPLSLQLVEPELTQLLTWKVTEIVVWRMKKESWERSSNTTYSHLHTADKSLSEVVRLSISENGWTCPSKSDFKKVVVRVLKLVYWPLRVESRDTHSVAQKRTPGSKSFDSTPEMTSILCLLITDRVWFSRTLRFQKIH